MVENSELYEDLLIPLSLFDALLSFLCCRYLLA